MTSANQDDLTKVVVPLYVINGDGTWTGLGSATIVAAMGPTAIAMTARHVVEDVADAVQSRPPRYPRVRELVAVIGTGTDTMVATAHVFSIPAYSDLAFLTLTAADDRTFEVSAAIDPSPVSPGIAIRSIGYARLETAHDLNAETGAGTVDFSNQLILRDGIVLNRHGDGIRHLTWPVVKVDTPFDSAMSGGPVFEVREDVFVVRAVICSDLSQRGDVSQGDGTEAYASEIWPSLLAPIFNGSTFELAGEEIRFRNFLDLFVRGFVADRGSTVARFDWNGIAILWNGEVIWTAPQKGGPTGWLPTNSRR